MSRNKENVDTSDRYLDTEDGRRGVTGSVCRYVVLVQCVAQSPARPRMLHTLAQAALCCALLLHAPRPAAADTPANCTYEDVEGAWVFYESERSGDSGIECQGKGDTVSHAVSLMIM